MSVIFGQTAGFCVHPDTYGKYTAFVQHFCNLAEKGLYNLPLIHQFTHTFTH